MSAVPEIIPVAINTKDVEKTNKAEKRVKAWLAIDKYKYAVLPFDYDKTYVENHQAVAEKLANECGCSYSKMAYGQTYEGLVFIPLD